MRAVILLCLLSSTAFAGYDDGARYAFLSSTSAKAVYFVDLVKREVAHELELAIAPDSVAASEALKALVIGHIAEQKLTLVDLSSDELEQFDYDLAISPDTVLVSPIGETVAIHDHDRGLIEVHALRRKEILVAVDDVKTTSELTFNPDGSTIYWVDQSAGELHAVDLWSDHKTLRLASEDASLSAMSRSVDGTLGFISNADSGGVYVVDLRSFALLRTNQVGDAPERPWGTADGRFMMVPNAANGTVTAISTVTSESLYTVEAVDHPVSVNPGWIDTVAAVIGRDGSVAFLSIDDGAELARAELNGVPEEGIVTSDSKTLAIPVPADGSLVFFDMQKKARLATIRNLPMDIGPASVAISNNLCH